MAYDTNNIFARILRGEIPCKQVFDNQHVLAFHDINPQAPTHVLAIPKGAYENFIDFAARASDAEIVGYVRALGQIAVEADPAGAGFRLLANNGGHAHQEVPHLHFHVFAGRPLGPMLKRA